MPKDESALSARVLDLRKELGNRAYRIISAPPENSLPPIELPAIDLTTLQKSFRGDRYMRNGDILRWLISADVAPNLLHLRINHIDVHADKLLSIFPGGAYASSFQADTIDLRIADMASKLHSTGLKAHQFETQVIYGLADCAEKIYVDSASSGFWKQFDGSTMSQMDMFAACARVALTCVFDLKGPVKAQLPERNPALGNMFMGKLLTSELRKPMNSGSVRERWESKTQLPDIPDNAGIPPAPPNLPSHSASVPMFVATIKEWSKKEELALLHQLDSALKRRSIKDVDWRNLALCVPGKSKNDCIQYFNFNKAVLGYGVLLHVEYDSATIEASRTRKFTQSAEDDLAELQRELQRKQAEADTQFRRANSLAAQIVEEKKLMWTLKQGKAEADEKVEELTAEVAKLKAGHDEKDEQLIQLRKETMELREAREAETKKPLVENEGDKKIKSEEEQESSPQRKRQRAS